jgi:2-iminobutanoate/2-iminopropanoate deaminase
MKKAVQTSAAPSAIGPYSQAVVDGDLIFCSGQIGIDPASGKMIKGGIEAETRRIFENLHEVLTAAGLTLAHVVKTTVFLVSLADFETVNLIYGDHFEAPGAIDSPDFSSAARRARGNRSNRAPLKVQLSDNSRLCS